ncbi:hypothetical protein WJX74_001299 [Apatococcus lobatus]|uniref:Uncharacterized protein n=1 Tax=Apatococcus lobatus TaxID=904363 RepID=A0AAW1S531_9CHLO
MKSLTYRLPHQVGREGSLFAAKLQSPFQSAQSPSHASSESCCHQRHAGCLVFTRSVSYRPARQKQRSHTCRASSEASGTIAAGKEKYKGGDRMGALKLFEDAVNQDPSVPERQSAHYHAMCVHASYGDVELAQISLRSGLNAGMDFEAALSNPDNLKMQASPQIAVQLKRFAAAAKKIKSALQPEGSARKSGGGSSGGQQSTSSGPAPSAADISSLFDTEKTGLDTSILGIARRVAILLLLLSALGTGLFFIGLKSLNQFQ